MCVPHPPPHPKPCLPSHIHISRPRPHPGTQVAFERAAEQERVLAKIVDVPDTAPEPEPAFGTGKVWQKPDGTVLASNIV